MKIMDSIGSKDRIAVMVGLGAGVALGMSTLYGYYRSSKKLSHQIDSLNSTIEELKRDVQELKIMSTAASQVHSPTLRSPSFTPMMLKMVHKLESNGAVQALDVDGQHYGANSQSDDNEEFYDFTEGDAESFSIGGDTCDSSDYVPIAPSQSPKKGQQSQSKSPLVNGAGLKQSPVAHSKEDDLANELVAVDKLLEDLTTNKQDLYNKIKAIRQKYGEKGSILWRLTKATHLLAIAAQKEGDKEKKKQLAFEAVECGQRGVEVDPKSSECHKWYAVAVGSLSDYLPTKEKIQNGHKFRTHVDEALKLSPDDPTLHHMLGRWSIEVASLSWVERKVATALFGKIPEASYEEALQSLIRCDQLRPEWKENLLFIGKSLHALKRHNEAYGYVERGINLPCKGEDDELAHKELLDFKQKLEKHRSH